MPKMGSAQVTWDRVSPLSALSNQLHPRPSPVAGASHKTGALEQTSGTDKSTLGGTTTSMVSLHSKWHNPTIGGGATVVA